MDSISNGPKYLNRTVNLILRLMREKTHANISVKNIRRLQGVEGSNRSAVAFYTNVLGFLEREGILKVINNSSPKKYTLINEKKLKSLFEG